MLPPARRMTHDPNNDKRLKDALRTWTVQTPLPPRFQENVWRRIETAERQQQVPSMSVWALLTQWLSQVVVRPAVAVAYVMVLAVLGVTLGFVQARNASAHLETRLGQQYVQSVDPYQKPR